MKHYNLICINLVLKINVKKKKLKSCYAFINLKYQNYKKKIVFLCPLSSRYIDFLLYKKMLIIIDLKLEGGTYIISSYLKHHITIETYYKICFIKHAYLVIDELLRYGFQGTTATKRPKFNVVTGDRTRPRAV